MGAENSCYADAFGLSHCPQTPHALTYASQQSGCTPSSSDAHDSIPSINRCNSSRISGSGLYCSHRGWCCKCKIVASLSRPQAMHGHNPKSSGYGRVLFKMSYSLVMLGSKFCITTGCTRAASNAVNCQHPQPPGDPRRYPNDSCNDLITSSIISQHLERITSSPYLV